jgi:hypothetical protein
MPPSAVCLRTDRVTGATVPLRPVGGGRPRSLDATPSLACGAVAVKGILALDTARFGYAAVVIARLLDRVVVAHQRVRDAEAKTSDARAALAEAIEKAHEDGFSLEKIGNVLGVSRQRVAQLKDRH